MPFRIHFHAVVQRALFATISIVLSMSALADAPRNTDVIILGNEAFEDIGYYTSSLKDPMNEFSEFEIVTPAWNNRWVANDDKLVNFGYENDVYWLKMNIDTSASIYKQWDLVIGTPLLDYVDVYQVFPEEGPRLIYRSGMARAFDNRAEDHRYFIVPLEIYNDANSPAGLLIRIQSKSTLYIPLKLFPVNKFWAPMQQADILNWMFFGVILAMGLYNLFLYSSVRDISYLYYVMFITSYALLHLSLEGYLFQHFWPESTPYSAIPDNIFSSMSVLFGFLFITSFLNLKNYLPRIHKIILFIVVLQLPIIALSVYYPNAPIDRFTTPLMGVFLLMGLAIGVYSTYRGLVTARYFLVAWLVFCVGNIYMIIVFTGTNLLPIQPLIVSKLASFAEAMLLSFALARRIRILREEREKQKIKAEAQSYFLAQISHEIRTPLNGVLGTVDLLGSTSLNQQQENFVEIIKTSGKSLLTLVNDVLDYSKIEAGKMSIQEEQIAIRDIAAELVELFQSQAEQKNLQLTLAIEPNVPKWIRSDSQRIRQVWTNLISNALKFTEIGSVKITLRVLQKPSGNQLAFSVKDTGIGISKSDLINLFNAYQQVDLGQRRIYGGTGLGLAICKELIDLMGGGIDINSQLNEGSEFIATIPLKAVTGPKVYAPDATQSITPLRPLSILVAEDNLVNQKVIHGLLTNMGHSVVIVNQGDKALSERMNDDSHFDIILMDCEMPQMDGYEATKKIRAYEQESQTLPIPIVALTAHALDEIRKRCLACGMNDFLTKPINTSQLIRTLNLNTSSS